MAYEVQYMAYYEQRCCQINSQLKLDYSEDPWVRELTKQIEATSKSRVDSPSP